MSDPAPATEPQPTEFCRIPVGGIFMSRGLRYKKHPLEEGISLQKEGQLAECLDNRSLSQRFFELAEVIPLDK